MLLEGNDYYAEIADQLFEMVEKEVSYPVEIKDKNEVIVFEVNDINPSRIQSLDEVKFSIADLWKGEQLKEYNLNRFLQFKSDYNEFLDTGKDLPEKKKQFTDFTVLQKQSIKLSLNVQINRQESFANENYPPELLKSIFVTDAGALTRVVTKGDEAFLVLIKKEYIDSKKSEKIKADRYNEYAATIRESIMNEIIAYLVDKNETQINLK